MVLTTARRRLLSVEIPLGAMGLGLVALAFLFAVTRIPPLPPAPLVRLGIASPLSGMTRSFVALAGGDPVAAFAWHPLGPPCFAAATVAGIVAGASWARGGRLEALARLLSRRWVWATVALAFAGTWARQMVVLG